MAHKRRRPPFHLKFNIRSFNFLLEILSIYIEREDELLKEKADKLKTKLLRYSIPYETEQKEELVYIRLFQNEAEDLVYILFNSIDEFEVETNYYEVLVKVRESLKKDNTN
ncbi:MAG: hypothetical protein E7313_04690 [Clostridiales bacterium]|nr:hypothetical protein [Clostridiales bacterium]